MNIEGGITSLPNTKESDRVIRGGSEEEEEIVFVAKGDVEDHSGAYPKGLELPENKEKHFQYLKNWKRIEKLAEEEDESGMVPKDCYSFISLHGPRDLIFWAGVMVFLFQMAFLILALLSIVMPNWNTGKIDDNPSESTLANLFATEVGPILRGTQFVSLITSIIFVDSSVSDIVIAINTFPNYRVATKDDKVLSMAISCILRLTQGAFAVLVSWFLVFNSNNVIEVILNFTALNFISTLDNILFDFCKTGKYGPYLEKEVKKIEQTRIPVCMYRKYKLGRTLAIFLPLAAVLLGFGAVLAVVQHSDRLWETKVFRVQFNDASLEDYNGCYFNAFNKSDVSRRDVYRSSSFNAEFGFCLDKQQWFLYEITGNETDPCDFVISDGEINETAVMIFSGETTTFDIETVFLDDWFSGDGTPADLFFWEEITNAADLKCDSFIGNGVCDDALNKASFDWDGGDCCAMTCTHSNCGIKALKGAFDSSNDIVGDGYPSCEDSDMYPLTIQLGSFSNSRDLYKNKDLPLSKIEQSYIEAYRPRFYQETPSKVLLTVYCEGMKLLKLYVDVSMQGKAETLMVPDEANCDIRFETRTSAIDDPIWYINYSVYDVEKGDIDPENTLPLFSENTRFFGNKNFERPPDCASKKLREVEINSDDVAEREAFKWLLATTESKNGKCAENYDELFGLAILNYAAPSSQLKDGLWVEAGLVCNWTHVACVGRYENTTLDLLELDVSGIQLSGSIPTNITYLSNLVEYDASNNTLQGSIPTEIGHLKNLTSLILSQNSLNGTIPTEIGLLTSLEILKLDSNAFTGSIPTEIGLLTDLKELYLGDSDVTGSIPSEIRKLRSLKQLRIFSNYKMNDSIPKEIQYLTDLEYLGLSGIGLSGTIPSVIESLRSLVWLDLANNTLTGTIPSVIESLRSLVWLDIANNNLTGSVPREVGLIKKLSGLIIDNTTLSGIADGVGNLTDLAIYMDNVGFSKDSVPPDVRKQIADKCNVCSFGYKRKRNETFECHLLVNRWEFYNYRTNSDGCTRLEKDCLDCNSFSDVIVNPMLPP